MKTKSDDQNLSLKELIVAKSCIKQDVYSVTIDVFADLKDVLNEITRDLHSFISDSDPRIVVTMTAKGDFELRMTLAGDTVVFHMHTNVFTFPPSHMVHKSPYVIDEPKNAYCGIINIYNFLTDSFKYQRMNDSGYLIGRIFVNRERHFFVEGQKQLGYFFNDFSKAELGKEELKEVLEAALRHVLNFELFTPPLNMAGEIRMGDIQELSHNLKVQTAKRLGFRFAADDDKRIDY